MIERLRACVGIAAMAGFCLAFAIFGCSTGSAAVATDESGESDAGSSDGGSPVPNYSEPEKCGPKGDVMTPAGLDAKYGGWKPSAAPQAACTKADLGKIETNINVGRPLVDWVKGTSEECKACAMSRKGDPHWAPLVITSDDGKSGFVNAGGCFALDTTPQCGRAAGYLKMCWGEACKDCRRDESGECAMNATYERDGQCKSIWDEVYVVCSKFPDELEEALNSKCNSVTRIVEALCGAEVGDAGTDAGSDGGHEN